MSVKQPDKEAKVVGSFVGGEFGAAVGGGDRQTVRRWGLLWVRSSLTGPCRKPPTKDSSLVWEERLKQGRYPSVALCSLPEFVASRRISSAICTVLRPVSAVRRPMASVGIDEGSATERHQLGSLLVTQLPNQRSRQPELQTTRWPGARG